MPAEEDEASLFDRKLKPLRLGPGVYARGMQTQITGAEILTSVSGGARCCPCCRVHHRPNPLDLDPGATAGPAMNLYVCCSDAAVLSWLPAEHGS